MRYDIITKYSDETATTSYQNYCKKTTGPIMRDYE